MSGDHAKIDRWRLDRSLERTAQRRPDIVARIACSSADQLSTQDREILAENGVLMREDRVVPVEIRAARPDEAERISELASLTFPMAPPDFIPEEDVQAFVSDGLNPQVFEEYLADPNARCFLAESEGQLLAYTLIFLRSPKDMPRGNGKYPLDDHAAYLSKCYAREEVHGSGIAGAILEHTIRIAREEGASQIVLGTHIYNERAQRFYRKHGFKKAGRRHFRLSANTEATDVVMIRPAQS